VTECHLFHKKSGNSHVPNFDKEDDRRSIKEVEDSMSSEEEVKADENARHHTTIEKFEE
jgi:hypothetical protein